MWYITTSTVHLLRGVINGSYTTLDSRRPPWMFLGTWAIPPGEHLIHSHTPNQLDHLEEIPNPGKKHNGTNHFPRNEFVRSFIPNSGIGPSEKLGNRLLVVLWMEIILIVRFRSGTSDRILWLDRRWGYYQCSIYWSLSRRRVYKCLGPGPFLFFLILAFIDYRSSVSPILFKLLCTPTDGSDSI